MMRTTDWKYDFSSLPRWDNRERTDWIYDEFFEIPQSDTLCCIYSITEVSMLNNQGFLAILRNKQNPQLVLNISEGFTFCVNFSVDPGGSLIFLQPRLYDRSTNRQCLPILILDIQNNRFSYQMTDFYCPRVIQKSPSVFVIEGSNGQKSRATPLFLPRGRTIRIHRLKWHRMDQLPSLPRMVF